ncbi:MAG: mitochondrial fission ELM1 family protein [Rhodospirillaceae bacterium]|nr:mitochondrial fission ELM1 family protein [Rhodospirillaceae bacterium]
MLRHDSLLWLLLDDRPGNAGQVRGVADALMARVPGLAVVEKSIRYTALGKLPNLVRGATLIGVTDESIAGLAAHPSSPWPDLVIAAGRRTAPVARWIKRMAAADAHSANAAPKRVRLVQIMNPGRVGAEEFDLIAIPNHDCARPDFGMRGGDLPRALRITGAPHRFSKAALAAEAAAWGPRLAHLPRPFVAVLVGGATRQRPFPTALAHDLGARAAALARSMKGAVLLTTSRRTGPEAEAALLSALADVPHHAYLWARDGASKDNPYGGYLALADVVVVTGDSTSMCSEACANPNAVFIYAPPDMAAPKHARLHAELYALGAAKPFHGLVAPFTHAPVNAAEAIADRIAELLAQN